VFEAHVFLHFELAVMKLELVIYHSLSWCHQHNVHTEFGQIVQSLTRLPCLLILYIPGPHPEGGDCVLNSLV